MAFEAGAAVLESSDEVSFEPVDWGAVVNGMSDKEVWLAQGVKEPQIIPDVTRSIFLKDTF